MPLLSVARPARHGIAFVVLLSLAAAVPAWQGPKRPLTHDDYDSWRSIQDQQLSPDGKFLAYALFPQEGDGELVARDLATGKEWRHNIGARPPAVPPDFSNPDARPRTPGITLRFPAGSRFAVFTTFPAKAETDQAKKQKKKAEEMPKGGLGILDLSTGEVFRAANVKGFQASETGSGFVAYLHEPAKKDEKASELVLRDLSTGRERSFPGVTEYSLTKDGKTLVYATGTGLFRAALPPDGDGQTIAAGKGKYAKLTWNEEQKRLAFLSDREGGAFRLYLWDGRNQAEDVVSASMPGLRKGYGISENGNLEFSRNSDRIFFGAAPKAEAKKKAEDGEERPEFELWHWKDDHIQPMQKVRAKSEEKRTYRAVFQIREKRLVQLADETLREITPSEDGRFAFGRDDRAYRAAAEYSERYADFYLVDTTTAERTAVLKRHPGSVSFSPDGRYGLFFDGRDWNTISAPAAEVRNLTRGLGASFFREEQDTPGTRAAYGAAGWTKDSAYVLLYDRFDIWQIAPDGSVSKRLTAGMGSKERLALRYVKLDPDEKHIDLAKPILLRAEHTETYDTGFFAIEPGRAGLPRRLLYGARNYTAPMKAKNADVLALTASTFHQFPDLLVTDASMKELRKVSDANPQKRELLWGTAELVRFRNLDGVPVTGALYKPENFDPKKKYPLLVYIYERLSQTVHQFTDPRPAQIVNIPYYVSNGYLVFTPDIVYTVGYPGESALKCVLPGVQAVVDRGFVNEEAVGIQGHSWGGYQIAYMVTRTKRFRAAAAGAPVVNMVSAYDGIRWGPGSPRQFQYERTQSRIGGSLWEFPERYIENSPIFQADRVNTPLLMLHNDKDDAVPWYQGIEYYLALRRLGKEVYLFNYTGEPHGLRRRANQKDYTMRLQQFFDHYLKGAPAPDWMERGIPYTERN